MRFQILSFVGVSLFAGASFLGCAADATSESAEDSAQALTIILPPPEPPPAFPTPAGCPAGSTCTFTPLAVSLDLPCTDAYWFNEKTGATSTEYMVAYCTKGFQTYATQIPNWIAQHPTWQAASSLVQVGLPAAEVGRLYLRFTPPTPTALPGFSTYAPGSFLPMGVLKDANGSPLPLRCSQVYQVTKLFNIPPYLGVMYCVITPELAAWEAAVSAAGKCTLPVIPNKMCSSAWSADGSNYGLVAPAPGYTYSEYSSSGGPIGGGCPGGCAHY